MSGYRSIHRQQVLEKRTDNDNTDIAIWSVQTSPLLTTTKTTITTNNNATNCWRLWTASSDGLVRTYHVQEKGVNDNNNTDDVLLDASALSLTCTHVLMGKSQQSPTQQSMGCTQLSTTRNYIGDDDTAGDFIVVSLDLVGTIRVWSFSEQWDDNNNNNNTTKTDNNNTPKTIQALQEFTVPNATGTTASLCPPKLFTANKSINTVLVAVGCLDGTIVLVSTGIPVVGKIDEKDIVLPAGTVFETWSGPGVSIPLSISWRPTNKVTTATDTASSSSSSYLPATLVVGRQDGTVDVLTSTASNDYNNNNNNNNTTRSAHCHRLLQLAGSPVRATTYTDDGHLLMAANDEGTIAIWDTSRTTKSSASPVLVHHVLQAHGGSGWILDIVSLSDSRRFVTVGTDKTVQVWNLGQSLDRPAHTFQVDHAPWAMQRGPNSKKNNISDKTTTQRLVTSSDNGWLQIFSLE